MTYLSGTRKVASQDRLFEPMYNLMVIVDALFIAISAVKKGSNWLVRPIRGRQHSGATLASQTSSS